MAVAIVVEATDSSLHRARDLQEAVSAPVLASIPTIVLDWDRAALFRLRLRHAFAATAVVVFCLMGGAATYVYVNGAPGWVAAAIAPGESQAPAGWEAASLGGRSARERG